MQIIEILKSNHNFFISSFSLLLISLFFTLDANNFQYIDIFIHSLVGIIVIMSPIYIQKYGKLKVKFLEMIICCMFTIQIIKNCFVEEYQQQFGLRILIFKMIELRLIHLFTNTQSILILLLYNSLIVFILIYFNQHIIFYIAIVYSTTILYLIKFDNEKLQQRQYVEDVVQTRKNSHIFTYIDQTVSKIWYQRLQSIPVGIMILQEKSLKPIYINHALNKLFDEREQLEKYLLDELEFVIMRKNRPRFKETSIRPKTLQIIQPASNFSNMKVMLSSLSIPTILRQILSEIQSGMLDDYKNIDNYLELSTTVKKKRFGGLLKDEEEENNLICKVFLFKDQKEILLIIDDITLQTNFKKLEQRQKFQAQLINSFSHELRTPLNSAQLFLQALLNDQEIPHKIKKNNILPACNSLKLQEYLIRDIIDFTQFHLQQINYNFETFQFEDLVQEINDLFTPLFLSKGLGLHIQVNNILNPNINSDFRRMMQILVNCLQNSIKFSNSGTVKILIEGFENHISFSIKDQGVGIKYNELVKIQNFLESFCQHRDFSVYEEWQGLGLIICQINLLKLAPQNKYEIQITSKGENQGTIVSFKIRTQQQSNTQLFMTKTLKRPSLRVSYTVPDSGFGVQGLLILTNQRDFKIQKRFSIQAVPTLHPSSLVQYFRPGQYSAAISLQQEENFDEEVQSNGNNQQQILIDTDRQSLNTKLVNLKQLPSNFLDQLNKKQPLTPTYSLNKRQTFKTSSYLKQSDLKSLHKANTLLSRMHLREEQEQRVQDQFEKLQFNCNCHRVLSVDDDSFNQQALKIILGQLGFKLDIVQLQAYNGKQALDIITQTSKCCSDCCLYCFILMDCQMPIMDGWMTTKQLCSLMNNETIPTIPIIGLTAFNSQDEIEKCYNAGMKEVLTKPLSVNELQIALIRVAK